MRCLISLTLGAILASSASSYPTASTTTSGGLTFAPCSSDLPDTLTCAELEVPIDWDDPTVGNITLLVSRLAGNPQKRIGNLYWNPGGPGISPFNLFEIFVLKNISLFPEEFDIIGPDPRGIGKSNPLQCDPDLFNAHAAATLQPSTEADFQKLVDSNIALGNSCLNLTGPVLGYLDSASVARDFEAVRLALGDDKINFLGVSYGTVVGQAYASMYADNIRTMALDGNLDHSLSESSQLSGEINTFENVFDIFVQWCANTTTCPLYGQDVGTMFMNLTAQADQNPVPAPWCVQTKGCLPTVTGEQMRFNIQNLLVFKQPSAFSAGWDTPALAIKQASEGNATLLSSNAAQGTLDPTIWGSGLGTYCTDWNTSGDSLSSVMYKTMMGQDLAPYTQGASQAFMQEVSCIGWPVPPRNYPRLLAINNTAPVLLTNSYHDTETSYVWANGILNQFQNAVLATRNGDGHTSYFLGNTSETHNAINQYLVTGVTPPPNTVYQT